MYGTMSSFVKLSYSWGYNAAEISFAQAALAAIFLGTYTLVTGKSIQGKITRKDLLPLILTGSAIGVTNYLYYQSVSYISASLAIVILMQFTWFSLFLEWIIFAKKPSRIELLTVFFILIGTVMAGNLFDSKAWSFSLKGILLALFCFPDLCYLYRSKWEVWEMCPMAIKKYVYNDWFCSHNFYSE